jgi:hypothetical protein
MMKRRHRSLKGTRRHVSRSHALIRAISDSYLKIGTILDVLGFTIIMLTIVLLSFGGDWLISLIQAGWAWR